MKTYHILNLGAGVQSTALYLMSHRQDEPELVPRFDFAIFADTQEEPRAVYDHLEWLKSLGGPPILTDTAGKLGDDLLGGKNSTGQNLTRYASIPTFCIDRKMDTEPGRNIRQCTKEYKIEIIERAIRRQVLGLAYRQRMPKDVRIIQYMGLSFDEPGRIIKVQARFQAIPWAEPRFPLFDLEMTRRGCLEYLKTAAPGRDVPRSACVFCPYRDNAEWRRIRAIPEEWARACQIDDALRGDSRAALGMEKTMYLHRSCKPLREAPIDTPESRGEQYTFGFAAECEGMCGV